MTLSTLRLHRSGRTPSLGGSTGTVNTKTGATQQTSAASIVMFSNSYLGRPAKIAVAGGLRPDTPTIALRMLSHYKAT